MSRIHYVDLVGGNDTNFTKSMGTSATITGATKANPCVITCSGGHSFLTGDYVYISGVAGMTQLNTNSYTVTYISGTQFSINTDSTAFSTYTSGGTAVASVTKASTANVTLPNHGFYDGQIISIASVAGMTQLNGLTFEVRNPTTNRFDLYLASSQTAVNSTTYSTYTSAGTITYYMRTITGITKANPAVVTSNSHGFSNGQTVYIQDVAGMTQVNDKVFTVANATANTFELSGINSSAYSTYTSGGGVRRCYLTITSPVTTLVGDTIRILKTFTNDSSIRVGSGNITFTQGSVTVTTSVDLTGSISAGNLIGLTTATGQGWDGVSTRPSTYYRVASITSSAITLQCRFAEATTTVSTINRLRAGTEVVVIGSASSAFTYNKSNTTVEGGYNGLTSARDGETFMTLVTAGDYDIFFVSGSNNTVQYLSVVSCLNNTAPYGGRRGFSTISGGSNNIFQYCSAHTDYEGYRLYSTANVAKYCSGEVISTNGGISVPLYVAGTPPITDNISIYRCYARGTYTSNAYGFGCSNTASSVRECKAEQIFFGFSATATTTPSNFKSCIANACAQGFFLPTGAYLEDCSATNCTTYGLTMAQIFSGAYIKNFTATGNPYGIYFTQNRGVVIENYTASGNTRDFYQDSYSGGNKIYKMSSTTPTTWSIDLTTSGGTLDIVQYSIDTPSLAKAFSGLYSQSIQYAIPQYTLSNCSQFSDGAYYNYGSIVKDPTVYRTSGSSVRVAYTKTGNSDQVSLPVISTYAKSATSKTISFYAQCDPALPAHSFIPVWKLNGVQIKTESAITNLTNSWDNFNYTCDGSLITFDGILTFELKIMAQNGLPIYLDDITIS